MKPHVEVYVKRTFNQYMIVCVLPFMAFCCVSFGSTVREPVQKSHMRRLLLPEYFGCWDTSLPLDVMFR